MASGIFYCAYKLKKDADPAAFLAASKALNDEHIAQQPGYISWHQVRDGDHWADFATFESLKHAKDFEANAAHPGEHTLRFYSFINMATCKVHFYEVEAAHGKPGE